MVRCRLVLAVAAFLSCLALDTQPEHDGFTTYCWSSRGNPYAKSVNLTDMLLAASDRGCPIQMRLDVGALDVVQVMDSIKVKWTVSYDLASASNALNMTQIYAIGSQKTTDSVQIPHSNLHACEFGPRPCNPFDRGVNPTDNTANQEKNFTGVKAQFDEGDLRFQHAGIYSLLAHVALPGENASMRNDFVVYKKIVVKDAPPPTAAPAALTPITTTILAPPVPEPTEKESSNTLYIVLGAVGALVVVAVAFLVYCMHSKKAYRKQVAESTTTYDYPHHPASLPDHVGGYAPSDGSSGARQYHPDQQPYVRYDAPPNMPHRHQPPMRYDSDANQPHQPSYESERYAVDDYGRRPMQPAPPRRSSMEGGRQMY
ncbi:Aste57867_1482 [Aphanomyces stellatus]|uniref:Aste57867_1482 protein n=1 Tax=Aphanomyces stellatus TaxID=120398 RepID=A0A485K6K1_9STRA|nr:hypothetical protein As57867_001481 [Aphanomyces stellatus]VFT78698.1 Aste57867_1482 [Aphanomyces stellatus]